MGGATRFVLLLATPFSLLRPQSSSLYRLGRLSLRPLSSTLSPHHNIALSPQSLRHLSINSSQRLHTQSNSLKDDHYYPQQQQQHPWPEWSKLVHTLSPAADVHGIVPEDAFVSYEYLSEEFVRSASSCLAFARNRPDILGLLSRKDIEVVVENGTPFLFKSALDTGRRMRSFLCSTEVKVLESDKAQTVDLMKYLLSYASNPTVSTERNNLYSRELIESSVRSLLSELAEVICGVPVLGLPTPDQQQVSGYYGHTPRPLGQNIEMKKGDWICPRCSFMNFARNLKCLECEEARPKRQLTGGEWECPQCDFFNYGRNTVCLRCDCRRPGGASFGNVNSGSGLGHNNGDPSVGRSLNQIIGRTSTFPDSDNRNISGENTGTVRSTAPRSGSLRDVPPKGSNSGYVPFVPLPANMFAKKAQNSNMEDNEKVKPESSEYVPSIVHDHGETVSVRDESGTPGGDLQLSEKRENEVENQNKKEQAEKSDRWFNRVAELHNVPDLTKAISDEDFPEIMPMRKGENRFVVSKKKDRSLTSPAYKRQSAMEQANNTKFVPFVPFPPDYFAKKDKPRPESSNATVNSTDEAYSVSRSSGMTPVKSDDTRRVGTNLNQEAASTVNKQIGRGNWSSNYSVNSGAPTPASQAINNDNWNIKYTGKDNISQTAGPPSIGNPSNTTFASQSSTTATWSSRYSGEGNAHQTGEQNAGNSTQNSTSTQPTSNLAGTSTHSPENQNVRSGWTGKSLEGSAVKDPDPLDMSEEAKAERWFRRVAQIKDISELSQIPDEDFPSIMPMRKGVNRFVVSKRKTPLERRLTSPQYRRNLPIVSSDPAKKENDSS